MHLGWSDEAAMIRVKLSEPVAEPSSSCNVFGGGTFGVARAKMPINFHGRNTTELWGSGAWDKRWCQSCGI